MSSLKAIEKEPFEELLEMRTGYVLDLSNDKFESLIKGATQLSIYDDRYMTFGDSKAKRLRAFWDIESDAVVAKALKDLLDYWEYKNFSPDERGKARLKRCREIVAKLNGQVSNSNAETSEQEFLKREFKAISFDKIPIESSMRPVLESRFQEAERCFLGNAPLASIILAGSVLEGTLLGVAMLKPKEFNQASSSPKDDTGKVRPFPAWKLSQLIDVSCELNLLKLDVKKFSHSLREFRNYIHPYEQMSSGFNPDKHTAEICLQVLRAAIAGLSGER